MISLAWASIFHLIELSWHSPSLTEKSPPCQMPAVARSQPHWKPLTASLEYVQPVGAGYLDKGLWQQVCKNTLHILSGGPFAMPEASTMSKK